MPQRAGAISHSTVAAAGRARTADDELRVLVASEDPFSRQAFCRAARGRGITVLMAAGVGAVADHLARELDPDVVVVDVQMAAAEGLAALQRVNAEAPEARILAFSSPATPEFGLLCIHAGAYGFLSKDIDLAALPRVLRSIGRGEAVLSRAFTTELVARVRALGVRRSGDIDGTVTAPERRVLELIRSGLTPELAASELGINPGTVRRHLSRARRRLSAPYAADSSAAARQQQHRSSASHHAQEVR